MRTIKFFKWLFVFSPILVIFGLVSGEFNIFEFIIGEVFCIGISFCIVVLWIGKDYKCPVCKWPFFMRKTKQEIVSRENAYVKVDTNVRDNSGNVAGSAEQYVPGVKTTYRVYYVCKHCGKVSYKTFTDSTPNI